MADTNLKISKVELRDYNSIVAMSNACFGQGFMSINKLNSNVTEGAIQLKALIDDCIIGFCEAHTIKKEYIEEKYGSVQLPNHSIYLLQTLVIHPKYQRKGYGSLLVKYLTNKLQLTNSTNVMLYPSWDEPKSQAFCSSLITLGFKELKIYKHFWFNDSINNNYSCLVCGKPPCTCNMRLMKLG